MVNVFVSVQDVEFGKTKWIDTRFSLQDINQGKVNYSESHVSGSVYWDLSRDLSDMTKSEGRHPMPDKEALTDLFRESGLEINDHIVVYDAGGSPFAARGWWLLQYAGFKKSFIALEGFQKMIEIGIPVDNATPNLIQTSVVPIWDENIYASREFVEKIVAGEAASTLVDARSAERYRGETEAIDPIAGRIPGALNFDWDRLKKEGLYRMDDSVKIELTNTMNPAEEVTVYCGSGVTAAPLYAMLTHNGFENVRLYVGSYSDWISRENVEVDKG
ncbi:sulfurtransferase [Sporosarcina limicola]|uniref:Thiosulfate/3-mercaptopyruvate sulfurtransferase n=1 Tax=Sporosarcina limicola TaxID=34101 RepID=A0A927MFI7_9BACL|nr:sulfurtransferase [Sporosarcina limicola]MBE1553655.1 thiosulfate/3-mercaptopyruvate sulfurtransferase [Sporosarcina limicola]